jgi:large subunit ribosomal protein L1
MARHGKKYLEAAKQIDETREYSPIEALALIKNVAFANFDETVEVHARLGIDPRQAEQAVRSTVTLPHGTGTVVRVLVFAAGEAERIALEDGDDYAGS